MDSKQRKTPVGGARFMRKKQQGIVIILAAALVVVALTLAWLQQQAEQQKEQSTRAMTTSLVCDRPTLGQAEQALRENDREGLSRVALEIKQHADFAIDPNCLYVLIKDASLRGDNTGAANYLHQFEYIYDADRGLDAALATTASVAALRDELAGLRAAK